MQADKCNILILWIFRPLLIMLILACAWPGYAENQKPESHASVLLSLKIKPYLEAVDGIRQVLRHAGIKFEIFFMEDFRDKDQIRLKKKLTQKKFNAFIAIGPEAARFMWSQLQGILIYSIVLNPENIVQSSLCGISLNIPVKIQIQEIIQKIPNIQRIGLIFDPRYNQFFFDDAAQNAQNLGVKILPLNISSPSEIPQMLEAYQNKLDAIWLIPDRTISSESIIRYIIKESLLKHIPVIGYNKFFYESGAALNFIFNYQTLGKQTAQLAINQLAGNPCSEIVPDHEIWLNNEVLNTLKIKPENKK